jgi:hypothetical protein
VNGRNWAFAFAAYLACYVIWFLGVFIGYVISCHLLSQFPMPQFLQLRTRIQLLETLAVE